MASLTWQRGFLGLLGGMTVRRVSGKRSAEICALEDMLRDNVRERREAVEDEGRKDGEGQLHEIYNSDMPAML